MTSLILKIVLSVGIDSAIVLLRTDSLLRVVVRSLAFAVRKVCCSVSGDEDCPASPGERPVLMFTLEAVLQPEIQNAATSELEVAVLESWIQ